ncbi:MAG: hypothetical protein AOA65_2325 [Candidatus Bathyarchaeota archaeon BA1]|nr:MAG: hypothetical protein AOA65_2325 [Candidatus Bathyarchaeota archaeon BA1]
MAKLTAYWIQVSLNLHKIAEVERSFVILKTVEKGREKLNRLEANIKSGVVKMRHLGPQNAFPNEVSS